MEVKTFEATLKRFDSDLWGHHFIVPDEISTYFIENDSKRVICSIDNHVDFHCALMPSGENGYFINVNKENRKKSKWSIGQTRQISLVKDESKYGMPIAEEMEEALASDNVANDIFHSLTAGKQRTLIYLASKPKTSTTRIKKSIIILDYLKEVDGELDFKELNQAFKDRKNDF